MPWKQPLPISAFASAKRTPVRWGAAVLAGALLLQPGLQLQAQTAAGGATAGPLVEGRLPGLGDGSEMSIADERRLGDSIARQIYRDPDYLDDPVLVDYLQSLWKPLLASARARGDVPLELSERLAWTLLLDRSKAVNAFALPGGYMGVNLGLLAVTDTPQELASVMAHELSHVSQRHIARLVARQGSDTPWVMAAMVLAALAARNNADVANAAIAGSQALSLQNQLNFSRDMEREADRVGFGVLTEAGFSGQGFVGMFDKLQQASRLNDDGAFPYLRSHPLTTERIADMRLRLTTETTVPPARSSPTASEPSLALHALMAARSKVLAETVPDKWRAWLRVGSDAKAKPADRYAAALSAHRLGHHTQAVALAQALREQAAPEAQPAADALLMDLLLAALNGTRDPRLEALRDAALASKTRAGLVQGALAALAMGQPELAAQGLQNWVVNHPGDALAWQTLARAQAAMGQRVRALRSEAESHLALLDHEGALARLKAAQALPAEVRHSDVIEMAIVDVRLSQTQAKIQELAREK